MKTWITSDTHFGHKNIIRFCQRPFNSIEEMDAALIKNWNSVVGKDDLVLHLGDFCFRASSQLQYYIAPLNGTIHIIPGNHDNDGELCRMTSLFTPKWKVLNKVVSYTVNKSEKVELCHYPFLTWNARYHGRVHLHGHIHSSPHNPHQNRQTNSYDVGVDNNGFTPILLEEAIKKAHAA